VKCEDYGKIVVDGKMLMPIKKDPEFENNTGEPEFGAVIKAIYDKKLQTQTIQILKRVSKESQVIYG
jgi:hypothetical protein